MYIMEENQNNPTLTDFGEHTSGTVDHHILMQLGFTLNIAAHAALPIALSQRD